MHATRIYQILNHYTPRDALDPGFEVLDNSQNLKPDWFEYWPMRNYLLGQPLDEQTFYGFLSPKFKLKTNLTAAQAREFIVTSPAHTDVVLFSPSIHNSAYFWNVFEHGDSEHPGLKSVAERFFARIGRPTPLDSLVTDSRNTVHSNYFIARPRFWRAWLGVTEQLYAIAEDQQDPLGAELRAATSYRGSVSVPMKIFLMERIATWLLVSDPTLVSCARDPFASRSRLYKLPMAITCDALKIAYATQGRGQYKDVFLLMRALTPFWNRQFQLGGFLAPVRRCLDRLKFYWEQAPR
jgi:hypothetical protein